MKSSQELFQSPKTEKLRSQFSLFIEKCLPESPNQFATFEMGVYDYLHEQGILHKIMDTSQGGLGLSVSDLIEIFYLIGPRSSGIAMNLIANLLGYSPVKEFGSKKLLKEVNSKIQKKTSLWSFGMTEKNIGSDIKNIQTRAVKVDGGYLLTGEKNYITNANYCAFVSVFAQTFDESNNPLGLSCFCLDAEASGVTRGSSINKMSCLESNTGNLFFKDVFVSEENLLGSVGDGYHILQKCISRSKVLLAAVAISVGQRAMDLTEQFLLENKRYGRPILEQKHIQHILTRFHAQNVSAALLVKYAAQVWDEKGIAVVEASMAKLVAAAMASEITGNCVELFGGRGIFLENEINRLHRDTKAIEVLEGTAIIQELIIMHERYKALKPAQDINLKKAA